MLNRSLHFHVHLIYIYFPMLFFSDSFSAFLLSCFPRCAIIQVPQGLLPASTSKKSAIPQLLCPGGLVLIITVQLQHIPSRPGHHFPSGGRLSPQVSFLQPAVASSNYTGGGSPFLYCLASDHIADVIFTLAPKWSKIPL